MLTRIVISGTASCHCGVVGDLLYRDYDNNISSSSQVELIGLVHWNGLNRFGLVDLVTETCVGRYGIVYLGKHS